MQGVLKLDGAAFESSGQTMFSSPASVREMESGSKRYLNKNEGREIGRTLKRDAH